MLLEFESVINQPVLIALISKSNEKLKNRKENKPYCAPNGSVTVANGFSEQKCNNLVPALGSA